MGCERSRIGGPGAARAASLLPGLLVWLALAALGACQESEQPDTPDAPPPPQAAAAPAAPEAEAVLLFELDPQGDSCAWRLHALPGRARVLHTTRRCPSARSCPGW